MYKTYHTTHFSTTSSVYSAIESESGYQYPQQHDIAEEDEDLHSVASVDSHLHEQSNQTFQSYKTALNGSAPSFSSINNSLLKHQSSENIDETFHPDTTDHVDIDETPKLSNYNAQFDPIDDTTPIVGAEETFPQTAAGLAGPVASAKELPQRDLNSRFKRLSVTLQTSSLQTSSDSHQFMSSFNENIRASQVYARGNRTSVYYARIYEKVSPSNSDDDLREIASETSVNKLDFSDTSSVSNRSSVISDRQPSKISESSSDFNFTNRAKANGLRVVKKSSSEFLSKNDSARRISDNSASGLNISYHDTSADIPSEADKTSNLNTSLAESTVSAETEQEEDLSTLFVRALHPFDSSNLQSESDASICLAFERDDIAVVHTIDESGWGEVTLLESLQRGWVPMNYFTFAIKYDDDMDDNEEDDEEDEGLIPNSLFLKPLFHSSGKILINPLSHKNRKGRYTFSIRTINAIRDGVRLLLQGTDCLSRSNEIVTKRPIVRKTRKSLLADWYNLMLKANEFKGTSNYNKIEILTLMVFQVVRKALDFLKVWSIESRQVIKRENEKKLQNDMNNYPLLTSPPLAKQRVTEINGILYSYLGLIIGRLDLIEHNSVGCDILETLTHHIILLLRELLFISKTGSDFSSEKPADLDSSLDSLLSLVSDLVTSVKTLVVKTLNESYEDQKQQIEASYNSTGQFKDYFYTQEGGELIQIAAKILKLIGITVTSIRKLLDLTGNFKLNSQRSYPDYSKMRIEPEEFIRKCSLGIAKSNTIKNRQLRSLGTSNKNPTNRFSIMRYGETGNLGLTPGGANLLHDILITDVDGASPSFRNDKEFQQYTVDGTPSKDINVEHELLVDEKGNLMGASFKGLVYTLTNEASPPEYFFVSTFFICFRSFANGLDLVEELIGRFDVQNAYVNAPGYNKQDVSQEVKMKNRRRLIAKMFQLWLESYWNHDADYHLLPTFVNFFNEGVSQFLPLDSMKLLDIAAKLSSKPLTENHRNRKLKPSRQLVTRSITVTRLNRKNSINYSDNNLTSRYSMVDGYELSKINTSSSAASSIKSMTLPMPLGVGNQTSSSNSLLSRNNLSTIEKLILTYRAIIGEGWCPSVYINPKNFIPLELSSILSNWFTICDQSWILSNYRPNLLDFNGLEIAKQLTIIESAIFCAIKPDELLNENYSSKRAHLNLAPNIKKSLLFTNCLSGYVLESILQPKLSNKMRINIIKTWLKVSISCLYLRNFNSLAAIITALQSHLITRLTRLWSDLSEKYQDLYDYLSGIIHPDKNYSVYRAKLKNFLIANDYNIPTVPYFSLFLQDLTFVTDGNPNHRTAATFLNQKLINIDKYLKLTRIIADIESLQIPYIKAPEDASPDKKDSFEDYSIVPVPSLQELILLELWKILQLNKKEEDRAWKLSCLIHPREAPS